MENINAVKTEVFSKILLAPCCVCESSDICCGDAESGLCREHCKVPHDQFARLAHVAANSR